MTFVPLDASMMGMVIGRGGSNIKKLSADGDVEMDALPRAAQVGTGGLRCTLRRRAFHLKALRLLLLRTLKVALTSA